MDAPRGLARTQFAGYLVGGLNLMRMARIAARPTAS